MIPRTGTRDDIAKGKQNGPPHAGRMMMTQRRKRRK